MSYDRNGLSAMIAAWVEQHREEAIQLVRTLVRMDSVNHPPRGREAECQQFVAGWMRQEGAAVDVYEIQRVPGIECHPAYMKGRSYENRPNVSGVFRGKGQGKSLLFSSHMDTVYEGKQRWNHPPFAAEIEQGRLYGRGAYDMKGGLAASLMAVKCLRRLGAELEGDVFVESVVDEEYGGANGTLAARLRGPHPHMAIIPEPSHLRLYSGHLGGGVWRAAFAGSGGVSFNGETLVSALDAVVDFARMLREYNEYRKIHVPAPELWRHGKAAEVAAMSIISGDPSREIEEQTPDRGDLTFWIEGYPGETAESIMEELWKYYETRLRDYPLLRASRPVITPLIRYLEASVMPAAGTASEAFVQTVLKCGERVAGVPRGEPTGAPFTCDGFIFNLYSPTPALILGPCGGNAHAPDEFLEISSYLQLICWYAEIAADWCGIPTN